MQAPKSSASYAPELPLTLTPPPSSANLAPDLRRDRTQGGNSAEENEDKGNRRQLNSVHDSPPVGSSGAARWPVSHRGESSTESPVDGDESTALLPSIDYAQYFANFEARPVDQHLKLSLKLDKKHFATPDSLLTLRCTSTQAQVLTLDSFSVTFLAVSPQSLNGTGTQGELARRNNRHQQHAPTHWHQRPVGAANNQIKQKYLHQYPRSSGQKLSSPSNNYYHDGGGQTMRGSNGHTNTLAALGKNVASKSVPSNIPLAVLLLVATLANGLKALLSDRLHIV